MSLLRPKRDIHDRLIARQIMDRVWGAEVGKGGCGGVGVWGGGTWQAMMIPRP